MAYFKLDDQVSTDLARDLKEVKAGSPIHNWRKSFPSKGNGRYQEPEVHGVSEEEQPDQQCGWRRGKEENQ